MAKGDLGAYRAKRDFARTSEPAGEAGTERGAGAPERPGGLDRDAPERADSPAPDAPRFVVQEHSATRLHWDLRLEHEGVLASWAVPNGIPAEPAENRLAVHTEDHPLEYLDFEGEIPKGEYGAGMMRIWDRGTFETHKWEEKKVEVTFHGERLRGRYGLFPIGRGAAAEKDWLIHRMDPPSDPEREPMPERLVPMLARAGELPTDPTGWAFEVKWDGVRAIAYVRPARLRLESRNLRDITEAYPEVRGLLRQLGMREAVLDGEIIAFDAEGKPSFERLQRRMHVTSPAAIRRHAADTPVVYAIFDLLYLDGRSLLGLPYEERRERLEALALAGPAWRVPARHAGDGAALLEATARQGLEGILAKRHDSRYDPGRRSSAWVKIKHTRRQELVIGGWLPGEGRRAERIGALLVGYHEADGRLRFAGRVGTGFTEAGLDELGRRLAPLRHETCPFDPRPKLPRGAAFVEPTLVAEVEFTQWTADGVMRAPSFKGLRDDKPAVQVVLESAPPQAESAALESASPEETPARGVPPEAESAAPEAGSAEGTPAPGAAPESASAVPSPPPVPPPAVPPPAVPEALFEEVTRLPGGALEVVTEGRRLKLTNWDKVLFPRTGFTKGDLIAYYARIAPAVLPHLRDRPLTLKRYPNGVQSQYFYEKNAPSHRPDWVRTARVASIDYILAQDRPTLIWLANLADIELHTSLSLARAPERPTMMVFDLDPGEGAGLLECCEVALVLHGLFEQLHLQSVAKTSGSKGMQVYVPLGLGASYAQTKPFAKRVAELLEQRLPQLVVSRMTRQLRGGKVLVDWSQNDDHKTTVTVYSVRARERPTVSTPVSWEEVRRARDEATPDFLVFETNDVLGRVRDRGEEFALALAGGQVLPRL